jgi:hypothetical protein
MGIIENKRKPFAGKKVIRKSADQDHTHHGAFS